MTFCCETRFCITLGAFVRFRLLGGNPRRDLAGFDLCLDFLLGLGACLTLDLQPGATFPIGLLAHFGFDHRLRLRLNLGFFFGREFRVHFGFDTGAIGGFFARTRLQALAIGGFSLLARFGFGFGGTSRFFFGLEARRHLGRGFGGCLGLRFGHPACVRLDARLFFSKTCKLFGHLGADAFFLIGQHGLGGYFGALFGTRLGAGQRLALGTQLFFQHAARLLARFRHHRRFDFGATLFVDLDTELFLHFGANLRFDFFLQLVSQIALRGFQFFQLFFRRSFRLHPLCRQRFCFRFGLGARRGQCLRFGFGARARRGQCALMFRFFFELFTREPIARVRKRVALFLFGGEF